MQILFIKHNRVTITAEEIVSDIDIGLDFVSFESYEELPSVLDHNVYCAVLMLAPRLTEDTLNYVHKIREKHYREPIYIVANVYSGNIYNLAEHIPDIFVYEPSTNIDAQVKYLIKAIVRMYQTAKNTAYAPLKKILSNLQENAIIIDSTGQLRYTNELFNKTFNFSGQKLPVLLNNFIPEFAYEDFTRKLFDKNAPSASIMTNFSIPGGVFLPVEIIASNIQAGNDEFIALVRDRSEIIALKRLTEFQNRLHEDLKKLIAGAFNNEVDPIQNPSFLDHLRMLFSCNNIFPIDLEWKNSADKPSINLDKLTPVTEKFLNVFANLAGMAIKLDTTTVYHFSPDNPTHSNYLKWAKTLIAIPVRSAQTNYLTVFLTYANPYEPDSAMFGLFELFANLLAYRFSVQEKAVHDHEINQNKVMVESSLDGIFKTRPDGTFLYVNQAFIDLLGYDKPADLYNSMHAEDLYCDRDDRVQLIENLKKKKVLRNNITRLVRRDGREIIVLEHVRILTNTDGETFIEGTLREISADIDVINVLADSRSFSDSLIENAGVIVTAMNDAGEFLVWNKKAAEVLGYSARDVLGSAELITDLFPEKKYRDFAMQKLNEAIFDESGLPIELVCRTKRGRDRILSCSIHRMKSEKLGEVNILFCTDLTDIRRLEKRVVDSQKMEAISGFIEIFTSQFKQMLHSISEKFHTIQENSESGSGQIYESINKNIREANHLIERISGLSGQTKSDKRQSSDADQLIENSFQLLRTIIPDRIQLNYDLNGFSMVQLEESQFNQIIMNLALNSLDAIEKEGEIRIESQKVQVDDDPFLVDNKATRNIYLKLSFSDTGKGMDKITRTKIFDPFFTTSADKSRIGLGITLIYNMVASAHGYINVESSPGKGTTIIIYLPVLQNINNQAPITLADSADICVLVVDDQLVIRELLKDILTSEGYKVILAEDGLQGLETYKEYQDEIDVVILDIIMPGLYGNEVYAKLKEINPGIRVVITSGHVEPEIIQELKKQGIDGYLRKPFDIFAVQKQLRNIIGA